jgi:hypothetical protein
VRNGARRYMSGLWKWDRNMPPCCGRVHEDCCAMEGDEVAVAIAGRPTAPELRA